MKQIKKRVLLLTAPRPEREYSPVHFGDNRPPQGLGYLAAYIKQYGHTANIIDLYAFGGRDMKNNPFVSQEEVGEQLNIDLDEEIALFNPDFIGMYVHSMSFEAASNLSEYLKNAYPHIQQIAGGPHPTLMPESIPATFDYVVSGEGEIALLYIIEERTKDRMIKGCHLDSKALENLPWPDFDLFWKKPYNFGLKLFNKDISPVLTISTSRGCPFRCRFCGVKNIFSKYTTISAHHIFERMKQLSQKYNTNTFYFREDCFTANLKRLSDFCDLIIKSGRKLQWVCESRVKELSPEMIEKMARAGCIGLYIGCESGSPRVLQRMRKDEKREDFIEKFPILKNSGIETYTTWVYGTPGETSADRALSDELIEILKPTVADCFVYIGIPISDYYQELYTNKEYEFLDKNGFLYPNGYLSLATVLYGQDDPRVVYIRRVYKNNNVSPVNVSW